MIYIPSYKRADRCEAGRWLSEAVLCVHQKEKDQYEREFPKHKIAVMPDRLIGKGMATIRNWVLEYAKASEDVLMVDDDVKWVGVHNRTKDQVKHRGKRMLKEEEFYVFVENAFRMTKELGTVLWGVNMNEDPKCYREYSPFSLTSVVVGGVFGVVKRRNPIRFDERLGLKEDFDYSLQVLNQFRKILRFNAYHYRADHLTQKGGCAAYRTSDEELEQRKLMEGKWGKAIVRFKRGDVNPVIKVPIPGI